MKKKIIALILILLIVCIFFIVKSRGKTNQNELTLYGNIEIRQVDLSFQVSGLVFPLDLTIKNIPTIKSIKINAIIFFFIYILPPTVLYKV